MHEVADDLARIEEWLRWADCDSDELSQLLDTAAEQTGALVLALRASQAAAPALYSPAQVELAETRRCLQRP